MRIVGLDIGRGGAVCATLEGFPDNPRRYFAQHRREFLKLKADATGIEQLLALAPCGMVMEPTGVWYSTLWKELADRASIPVYWIGHGDLAALRGSYGFRNKRDDEDAFCLALSFFDNRFVDSLGRRRFLSFESGTVSQVRELFFQLEQLDKCRTTQVN